MAANGTRFKSHLSPPSGRRLHFIPVCPYIAWTRSKVPIQSTASLPHKRLDGSSNRPSSAVFLHRACNQGPLGTGLVPTYTRATLMTFLTSSSSISASSAAACVPWPLRSVLERMTDYPISRETNRDRGEDGTMCTRLCHCSAVHS